MSKISKSEMREIVKESLTELIKEGKLTEKQLRKKLL